MLRYLKRTKNLKTTLGADGSGMLRWYVDAAFAVHPDMRSHTGGVLTMGHGGVITISSKQKLYIRAQYRYQVDLKASNYLSRRAQGHCAVDAKGEIIEIQLK